LSALGWQIRPRKPCGGRTPSTLGVAARRPSTRLVTVAGSKGCAYPRAQMPAAHPIHPDRLRGPCQLYTPGGGASVSSLISLHQPWTLSGPCHCARAWFPGTVSLPPWSRSQFQFLIPTPPSSGRSTLMVQPPRAKQADTLYACLFCAATGRNVRAMMLVSHSRRPSYSPCAPHSVHYFHSSTYTWILFAFPCPGRFLSTFDWVSSQCRRPQEGQPDPPPRITPSGGATAGPGHHSLSPAATRWKLAGAMSSSRGVARKARCRWSWGWGVFLSMSSCPRWETKSGSPCSQGAADASPLLPKRDDSRPL
jgi:hypothetical protein